MTTATIDIWEYSRDEIKDNWCEGDEYPSGLWWPDFEEAGIERCFIAWVGDDVAGFITIDGDGLCTAIEVKTKFQGRGVARSLVEESNCWKPADDQNPEFWAKMADEFGW